jgi:mono/diheme cytochrome c family protein
MRTLSIFAAGAAAIGVLGAGAPVKADPQIARGRALFATVGCYECHGYAGQGGAAGPHIAAIALPYAAFSAYVRHPAREMPPFTTKALGDADLAAIYAYVRSLPAPPRRASPFSSSTP